MRRLPNMPEPELTFEESEHVYRLDGRIIPSVTQVLEGAGLYDPSKYPPDVASRGSYVHVLTALNDRGELTVDMLGRFPEYDGYMTAWRQFVRDSGIVFTGIEVHVHGSLYGLDFGGTVDRIGKCDGSRIIIDIKSGAYEKHHAIQTAGYLECMPARGARYKRWGIYVHANGKSDIKRYADDASDRQVFGAQLVTNEWKARAV